MTITPELEAVARAIYSVMMDEAEAVWDDLAGLDKVAAIAAARAALVAIREPTEGMRDRAYNACAMNDQWCIEDGEHWAGTHRASVDYILSEKKP